MDQRTRKRVVTNVITNKENLQKIRKMIINEIKEIATYKTECQQDQVRKTYSDHNVILLEISQNWKVGNK